MRTSHVTHSANILTHFLLTQYFCLCVNFTFLCGDLNKYLTKYRQSQEIFYNVCSEAKCVIINLKLFVNKICKNASNLTHYLTTKNFCNLLKFETKTRFSNCQKVVRIFHPILLWQITSRPGYLFSKSNFSTRSYFCFPVRAGRCFVSLRHSRCSWRTWWAASTPCTPSARGWRSLPWSAAWSRSGCSGQATSWSVKMIERCSSCFRGLGAIQPGVNRCKLLSDQDFDELYKDCTTQRWVEEQSFYYQPRLIRNKVNTLLSSNPGRLH